MIGWELHVVQDRSGSKRDPAKPALPGGVGTSGLSQTLA
jgi:hypothetical protein